MPKWEKAKYRNANGDWEEITLGKLAEIAKDAGARASLREKQLWSEDEEYRLSPRFREDAPHFYSPSDHTRTLCRRQENSQEHQQRCEELLQKLSSSVWTVGFNFWKDQERFYHAMFDSQEYLWGTEITRALTSDIRWRHDIFGAKMDLRTSERFPWLAIEVIDSHFPDEKALKGWLKASACFPYVVAFDFVRAKDYFLQFKDNNLRMTYLFMMVPCGRMGIDGKIVHLDFLRKRLLSILKWP